MSTGGVVRPGPATGPSGLRHFARVFARNRLATTGAVVLAGFVVLAVVGGRITPHEPTRADLSQVLKPPAWGPGGDWSNVLGCDHLGRDLLSRIIVGSRISIVLGLAVVGIVATIGTILGLVSGYLRGGLDRVLTAIVDILLAFPMLVFALGLLAFMGPSTLNLILALSFKTWVDFFRLTRGDTLSQREQDYVLAAGALGATRGHIMFREILPNIVPAVIVLATLTMANIIIAEASLSFLGIGVQPPTPAWGSMVADGRRYMLSAWWISTFPGVAILLLVLSINLVGQGLRDALDPRLKD